VTGRKTRIGGTMIASVSHRRSRSLRAQSTATASRASGESTVHQKRAVIAAAAKDPAETSNGMPAAYRRPAAVDR
jgi:hypothetical protein